MDKILFKNLNVDFENTTEVTSYLKGLFRGKNELNDYHNMEDIERINDFLKNIFKEWYINPKLRQAVPKSTCVSKAKSVFFNPALPKSKESLFEILHFFQKEIMPKSIHTWNPDFMAYMFSGPPLPAAIGELLAIMLNPTLSTLEMSLPATLIEQNVIQWMTQLLNMPEESGGIFLPGGSFSNRMGLLIARNRFLGSNLHKKGLFNCQRGVILCSASAHYSIESAANILGIGIENVIKVKTNQRGEMLVEDLKEKLQYCQTNSLIPFAIVVTMGITTTGGCDPLKEIIAICRDRNIHIHVDAAFGSTMAFSSKRTDYFQGIEHADTVTWDIHKGGILGASLSCSVLLAKTKSMLKDTFAMTADYLFHESESQQEIEDLGLSTPMCGKRFDALKVWIIWKTYGTNYLQRLADQRIALTDWFYKQLSAMDDFEPAYQPINPIICYRFIPSDYKAKSQSEIDYLQKHIRNVLKEDYGIFVNYTTINQKIYLRCVFTCPLTKKKNVLNLLSIIKKIQRP